MNYRISTYRSTYSIESGSSKNTVQPSQQIPTNDWTDVMLSAAASDFAGVLTRQEGHQYAYNSVHLDANPVS